MSYLEGCTAPAYDENQLHAAVVELSAAKDAEIKYSTVQNWCALALPAAPRLPAGHSHLVAGRGGSFGELVLPTLRRIHPPRLDPTGCAAALLPQVCGRRRGPRRHLQLCDQARHLPGRQLQDLVDTGGRAGLHAERRRPSTRVAGEALAPARCRCGLLRSAVAPALFTSPPSTVGPSSCRRAAPPLWTPSPRLVCLDCRLYRIS